MLCVQFLNVRDSTQCFYTYSKNPSKHFSETTFNRFESAKSLRSNSQKGSYHNVPNEMLGLGVHASVPGAYNDLLAIHQVHDIHRNLPETPTPILPGHSRLLWMLQVTKHPRFSIVNRHFHPNHFPTTTCSPPQPMKQNKSGNSREICRALKRFVTKPQKRWSILSAT